MYGAEMDGTQGVRREQMDADGQAGGGNAADSQVARADRGAQTTILRISWALTWAVPVVALVVGIVLTATGVTEVWTPLGDDTYDVTMLAVWPAGIALMAVGVLGTTAAAIATAVSAKR